MTEMRRNKIAIPVEFDMGDNTLSCRLRYQTYARSAADAIETGELFIKDEEHLIAKSMSQEVSNKIGDASIELFDEIEADELEEFSAWDGEVEGSFMVGDIS